MAVWGEFSRRPLGTAFLSIWVSLLALIIAACSNSAASTSGESPFAGTQFNEVKPATPFQLQNQLGESASLSDYSGKVVLLTFLYTNCPDVCPASTSQIIEAQRLLSEEMDGEVAFVAVSVDPERDTPESVGAFLERWKVGDNWDFLVGSRAELEPLWKAYFVASAVNLRDAGANIHVHPDGSVHAHDGLSASSSVDALRQGILDAGSATEPIDESNADNRYFVIHSAPVFLIDREGNLRVVHTQPLEPEAIARDVELLSD